MTAVLFVKQRSLVRSFARVSGRGGRGAGFVVCVSATTAHSFTLLGLGCLRRDIVARMMMVVGARMMMMMMMNGGDGG